MNYELYSRFSLQIVCCKMDYSTQDAYVSTEGIVSLRSL